MVDEQQQIVGAFLEESDRISVAEVDLPLLRVPRRLPLHRMRVVPAIS